MMENSKKQIVSKLKEFGFKKYNSDAIVGLILFEINKQDLDIPKEIHYEILHRRLMVYANKDILEHILDNHSLEILQRHEADLRPDLLREPLDKAEKRSNVAFTPHFIEYNCPACGCTKATYTSIIVSSMDESKAIFYTCTKCNFKSKATR